MLNDTVPDTTIREIGGQLVLKTETFRLSSELIVVANDDKPCQFKFAFLGQRIDKVPNNLDSYEGLVRRDSSPFLCS